MKNRKHELDVDIIGEQGRTLTQEERQEISDFIKRYNAKQTAQAKRLKNRPLRQKKKTV